MRELIADILRLIANHLDPAPESDAFVSWPVTWETDTTYFYPTVTVPEQEEGGTGGTPQWRQGVG